MPLFSVALTAASEPLAAGGITLPLALLAAVLTVNVPVADGAVTAGKPALSTVAGAEAP